MTLDAGPRPFGAAFGEPYRGAADWSGDASPLRAMEGDTFAFALAASDMLAPLTARYYAEVVKNLIPGADPTAEQALVTARAMETWPDRSIPGAVPRAMGTKSLAHRFGLTTVNTLLRDDASLLALAPADMPFLVLTGQHGVAAGLAAFFWAFHAEIQNVPPLKVNAAATLAQALIRYGRRSAMPEEEVHRVREDGIPVHA